MFATVASLLFIEKLGRRPLVILMAAAQAVAFLGVAISTEIGGNDCTKLIPGLLATVCISLYFLAFGFGWVSIPWLFPAEVNSLSMRTKGAALATAMDWLFNYVVMQTTPIGIHYLHWGRYLIYAILNAAFVPIVYYLIVETAGKSLEQIDRWFISDPGWLVRKADHAWAPKSSNADDEETLGGADEGNEGMVKTYEEEEGGERNLCVSRPLLLDFYYCTPIISVIIDVMCWCWPVVYGISWR